MRVLDPRKSSATKVSQKNIGMEVYVAGFTFAAVTPPDLEELLHDHKRLVTSRVGTAPLVGREFVLGWRAWWWTRYMGIP